MRSTQIAQPHAATVRNSLGPIGHALRAEGYGLLSPSLWLALAMLLLVFLLVAQLPLRYVIDVGNEEGVGSDLPFLSGFNSAERDSHGSFRWTNDGATIQVPGVGSRPLALLVTFFPIGADVVAVGPKTIAVYAGTSQIARLPVRPAGSTQTVLVPAPADGSLRLSLRTTTWSPPDDPRALGTPLTKLEIVALRSGSPALPDWQAVFTWLVAVAAGWLAMRHALGVGWQLRGVLAGGVMLVALAAVLDPPRWAFGASAALVATTLGYALAIVLRAGLPALARRLAVPLDRATLGWLVFFCTVSFGLRYGGRLYPGAMHGDIGFHVNRFNDAIWGLIYILSKNRGVDFPYPPGPYLLVAPFGLLGVGPHTLLQLGAALVDALSAVVVYAIAARVMSQAAALLAAAIYVFTAATFMTTWWSFDTHIYSQFFHLLTIAAICWGLEVWQRADRASGWAWAAALFVLLSLVFLGHFGFLINTTLLVGLVVASAWLLSWRGVAWAVAVRWPLSLAYCAALCVAALFFYTAYLPLFLGQLQVAQEGGLSAVAGREPVSRAVLWDTLWRFGLITHFGFFPLPLAAIGILLLARGGGPESGLSPRAALIGLMLGSLAVAVGFAALPFVTQATNSPRWLMSIAWVVAIGAAIASEALWRSGRAGKLATLAMGSLVIANTAWIWLAPMLWRIRPPEPF